MAIFQQLHLLFRFADCTFKYKHQCVDLRLGLLILLNGWVLSSPEGCSRIGGYCVLKQWLGEKCNTQLSLSLGA
jgi:hypothetical protein